MVMTNNTIRYCIPLYGEKEHLGKIVSTKVIDNNIVVVYKSINTEALQQPVVRTFDDKDFIIDFSK